MERLLYIITESIASIAIAIILFITIICVPIASIFNKKIRGLFMQVIKNPIAPLAVAALLVGLMAIWFWDIGDELGLIAWIGIAGQITALSTIMAGINQYRANTHLQQEENKLKMQPCVILTKGNCANTVLVDDKDEKSIPRIEQNFEYECVSEYPAFGLKWYSWRVNTKQGLDISDYEKHKRKITTSALTAVKGQVNTFVFADHLYKDETAGDYIAPTLVAEFTDIRHNKYFQLFSLKLSATLKQLEIDEITPPHPLKLTGGK